MARRAIKTAKPRMWALWNENKKLSMKLCSLQSFTRSGKRRSGDIAAAYKVFARFGSKNESCHMGKIIVQWRMKTFVWFMPPRADSLRVQSIVKQLRAHDGMSKLTAVEASAYWISLLISIDYSRHRITLCLHRHQWFISLALLITHSMTKRCNAILSTESTTCSDETVLKLQQALVCHRFVIMQHQISDFSLTWRHSFEMLKWN